MITSVLWGLLTLILIVLEGMTFNFITIWFALGSLTAAGASLMGASTLTQLILFTAISLVLSIITFPFVSMFKNTEKTKTNSDRIINQKALVVEKIDTFRETGLIRVLGQTWTASSDKVINEGSEVVVVRIEGVKAVVEEI